MKNRIATAVVCLALSSGATLFAESYQETKGRGKTWWASVAALIGASALDAQSSWGRQELNPVLRGPNGEFGAKGIAIKAAIAGGVVAAQYLLLKDHPAAEKYASIANFGMASVLGGVAVYNHNNRGTLAPPPAPQSRPAYLVDDPAAGAK